MTGNTEMNQFSAIVERLRDPATASVQPSAKCPGLHLPTTDAECAALREWATTTQPFRAPAATIDQLAKHLEFMAAALPSKGLDEQTGKKKAAVYASLLGGQPNEALAYMARTACMTLDWFPTPRQCLDIIADYRPPVSDQEVAIRLCQDYTSNKFDRWIANLTQGQPVGDVPEQWKRIAVEQGAMRRLSDGSYVSRALYHGPYKPVSA